MDRTLSPTSNGQIPTALAAYQVAPVDLAPLQRKLDQAQFEEKRLRKIRDGITSRLEEMLEDGDWTQGEKAAGTLAKLLDAWQRSAKRVEAAEYQLRRGEAQNQIQPELERLRSERFQQLERHYRHHGPVYEMLVVRAIDAELRARATEMAGLLLSAQEHRTQTLEVLAVIDRLQKYTESSKTEMISGAHANGVMAALEVANEVFGDSRPELYQKFLHAVYERTESGDEPNPLEDEDRSSDADE